MRKFLLVLLSAVVLLAASCSSWMKDDDFYSDIENDVKIANAEQISVYVRYALTRQGSTDPDGPATFKVEIPHEVSATTEPEYGFVRWAAFTTDFLATGDNQQKNKDVYFIDEADYNRRLLPHEIQAPVVEFDDPTSPTTMVTINEKRDDLFLVPIVAQRPAISLTIPAVGSSDVVRNMTVRINFTKPMDAASFKNEDGQYDKITITQGIISFSSEGDMEITSEDITEKFQDPEFSKNKKMITLKFKPEAISEGFAANASVNITISKDVKDSYGFAMADDQKVSFTVGSSMDTLAPRITQLTAGTSGNNFYQIKGMYKDPGIWPTLGAVTKMESHAVGTAPNFTYPGATQAVQTTTIGDAFFNSFIVNRLTGRLYIRVWAEDLAGSGSHADPTGIENDVQIIVIRSRVIYNADGSTPSSSSYSPLTAINYVKEGNMTTSLTGSYESLMTAANNRYKQENSTQNGYFEDSILDKGCLVEYDISSLPDGLIEIQVAAVDTITNNGFEENAGGQYSSTYGNGWASLFVVKDTTPPDPVANSSHIVPDLSGATNGWFNSSTYSAIQITGDTAGNIVDYGHARLRSNHSQLKWVIKPTDRTDWVSAGSPWQLVTSNYSGFEIPSNQGANTLTYALMDDLGNMSGAATACSIYYDSVNPLIKSAMYFTAEGSETPGVASTNVLTNQTLVIPVREITSGVKSITLDVVKEGETTAYDSPFSGSLTVKAGGSNVAYTVSGKTITFTTPVANFDGNITIKGIKIYATEEDGSYKFNATIKDAAANSVSTTTSQEATISIDNTDPVISRMYIPRLKRSITAYSNKAPEEDTTKDGWFIPSDFVRGPGSLYSSGSVKPLYIPLYLFVTEADSGVHQIVFRSSDSVELDTAANSRLVIKKIENYGTTTQTITTIPTTDYVINNTKTITFNTDKCVKASSEFVLLLENIGFKEYTKANNTINVSVYDLSTRHDSETNISVSDTGTQTITGVKSDAYRYSNPSITINDQGNTATTYTSYSASSYTNDATVNLTVTVPTDSSSASANSGINSLRLSGAVFTSTTTVKYGNQTLPHELSANNTVLTFKNSDAYITIHESTAQTLIIENVQLTNTTADGSKTVYLTAIELAGWETSQVNNSIVLDRTAPILVGAASGGVFTSSWTDSSVPYYQPGVNVYPHSGNYGKMVSSIPTFYTATTYKTGCSQYNGVVCNSLDLSTTFTHSAVLAINATDNIALYGDTSSSTFIIYKAGECTKQQLLASSNGGTRITSVKMANSNNSATNSTFHVGFDAGSIYSFILVDKAGNVSDVYKFRVVTDITKPVTSDMQNRVLLKRPDASSNIYRNTEPATSDEFTSYKAYESTSTSSIKTLKYVTKSSNTKYQVILNLGSTYQSTTPTLVSKLNGSSPTTVNQYGEISATTSASPIERYCISTWYGSWPTDSTSTVAYTPVVPYSTTFPSGQTHSGSTLADMACTYFGGDSTFSSYWRAQNQNTYWHTFGQSTISYTESGNGIKSWVDANYNLIIEIPNDRSIPPISVFLRDGCGNMSFVVLGNVTESSISTAPSFILDNKLGKAETTSGIVLTPVIMQNPHMTYGGTGFYWGESSSTSLGFAWNKQSGNTDTDPAEQGVDQTRGFIKDSVKKATYYNPNIDTDTTSQQFKLGLTLRYGGYPESITYGEYAKASTTDGNAGNYTCRALLYCSKTRSALPTTAADINAFYTEIVNELAAEKNRSDSAKKGIVTDWTYVKASSGLSELTILLDYPKPNYSNITDWNTNLSNGEPDPYYIWYVFEDRVGNYEIGKVVNSGESGNQIKSVTSGMYDRWLYDNDAPVLTIRGTTTNPSTITAANISSLVAENNGFKPYAKSNGDGTYNVYVHAYYDFSSVQSGATKNTTMGNGTYHTVEGNDYSSYTPYNPFVDLEVSEKTGVRAFAWSTTETAVNYTTSYTDYAYYFSAAYADWFIGWSTITSSEGGLAKSIGGNWSYSYENAYYGSGTNYSGKYSGIKVNTVIPYKKIESSANPLYLHVMDWTGNIATYRMGSNLKFINDSTAPAYTSTTVDGITQPDQYYISKTGSTVTVRIAGRGAYANSTTKSDIKLYIPTSYFTETGSGIKGYSFAGTGISNATSDANGPYLNLTWDKYHYTSYHPISYYVYDNVGNRNNVTLDIIWDDVAPEISKVTFNTTSSYLFCDAETGTGTSRDYSAKTHSGDSAPYHSYQSNINNVPEDVIQNIFINSTNGYFSVQLANAPDDLSDIKVNKWNSSSNEWTTVCSVSGSSITGSGTDYTMSTSSQLSYAATGTYYQIYTVDQSGNTSCQYFRIYLDTTAPTFTTGHTPTVTITKGSINKDASTSSKTYYYTADSTHKMTINFTLEDAGIGSHFDGNKIKYYYRWGDTGDWTDLNNASATLEFDGTFGENTDTRVLKNLRVKDELGNTSTVAPKLIYNYGTDSSVEIEELKYYAGYSGTIDLPSAKGSWNDGEQTNYQDDLRATASGILIQNQAYKKMQVTFTKPAGIIGFVDSSSGSTPSTATGAYSISSSLANQFEYDIPMEGMITSVNWQQVFHDKTIKYYAIDYVGNAIEVNVIYTYDSADVAKNIQFIPKDDANVPTAAFEAGQPFAGITLTGTKNKTTNGSTTKYYKDGYILIRCTLPSNSNSYAAKPKKVELYDQSNEWNVLKTYTTDSNQGQTPTLKVYNSGVSDGNGRYYWYLLFNIGSESNNKKLMCCIIGADNSGSAKTTLENSTWKQDNSGPKIDGGNYLHVDNGNTTNIVKEYKYSGTIATEKDNVSGSGWVSVAYSRDLKFYLLKANVKDSSGIASYKITKQQGDTETDSEWQAMVTQNVKLSGDTQKQDYYEFTLPDMSDVHSEFNLYFKDNLGNVSEKYELANPSDKNHQWWILNNLFDPDQTSMTSPTWSDTATDYTFSINAPAGSIIKNVTVKVGGTAVTPAAIEFAGYNSQYGVSPAFDGNQGWINISGINVKFAASAFTKGWTAKDVEITVTGWNGTMNNSNQTNVTKVLTATDFVPARTLTDGDFTLGDASPTGTSGQYTITVTIDDGAKGLISADGHTVKVNGTVSDTVTAEYDSSNKQITLNGVPAQDWVRDYAISLVLHTDDGDIDKGNVLTITKKTLDDISVSCNPSAWAADSTYEVTVTAAAGYPVSTIKYKIGDTETDLSSSDLENGAVPSSGTFKVTIPAIAQTNAQQDVKLIVNSFTKDLFSIAAAAGGGGGGGAGGSYRDNGAAVAGGISGGDYGTGTGFFRSIQNFFSNDSAEIQTSKKAKKASKKAKKTTKAAKKADKAAVISAAPVAVTITEQPEIAITEQTSEVPVAAISEFAASDITKVSAQATAESVMVQSAEPEAPAKAAEEKSSNTAVIVVMLAILASCGGAWFTLARKKK